MEQEIACVVEKRSQSSNRFLVSCCYHDDSCRNSYQYRLPRLGSHQQRLYANKRVITSFLSFLHPSYGSHDCRAGDVCISVKFMYDSTTKTTPTTAIIIIIIIITVVGVVFVILLLLLLLILLLLLLLLVLFCF